MDPSKVAMAFLCLKNHGHGNSDIRRVINLNELAKICKLIEEKDDVKMEVDQEDKTRLSISFGS